MPKQISNDSLTKTEKHNRVLEIIAMISAFVFGGSLIALLHDLMRQESGGWRGCVIFAAYCLFLAAALVHFFHGIHTFKKIEHYGILFQSILSAGAAVTAIVNIEFALMLFFESIGNESAADKILGDREMSDFIASQYSNWTMLLFGIGAMIVIGITAIMRLAKKVK